MLFFDGRIPFATGVMDFLYSPLPPEKETNRIQLKIRIEGMLTIAVFDTGAPYLILSPVMRDRLRIRSENDIYREESKISHRGWVYTGNLSRIDVTLEADTGEGLTFNAVVFVPNPGQEEEWSDLPPFLGMYCCMDRIRFAIDPSENKFYFGVAL